MRYCEGQLSVVQAKIQTVEDMYRLIWTAIANKQPISAIYKERYRLFVLTGWAVTAWASLAFSAINMAERVRPVWRRSVRRRTGVA
jgi:hypothetical protein